MSNLLIYHVSFCASRPPVVPVAVFSIPENISGEILKAVQSIYPMQNVYIRKVKALKKPKFDRKSCCTVLPRFEFRMAFFCSEGCIRISVLCGVSNVES